MVRSSFRSLPVLALIQACMLPACWQSTPRRPGLDASSDPAPEQEADAGQECIVGGPGSMVMDLVTAVSDPVDSIVTVTFQSSAPVLVDVSTALGAFWAELMDRYRQEGRPVYVELDPGTRMVIDFLFPLETRVQSVTHEPDGVEVLLTNSHAVHFLWRSNPCFDHLLEELEAALEDQSDVLVTEDDELGIVDIRPPFGP